MPHVETLPKLITISNSLSLSLSLSRYFSHGVQNHTKLEDGPFVAGFFSFGFHLRRGGGSSGVGRVLLRLGLGLLLLRREFFLAGTFVGVPVRLARDGRFERFRIISGRGGEVAARSAGDVSLGNSRVQANGLSNSLSDRKHFYYVSKECVV